MNRRLVRSVLLISLVVSLSACMPQRQFYWGQYEDSLYARHQHAGTGGEAHASGMLATTLAAPPTSVSQKVGPGIHADYGYLLFKQGRPDEAIAQFQQEAATYPESKLLMDSMVSRIQERKKKDQEKTPTP